MEHYCTLCKKEYSSYKSLWNHIKKYHTEKFPHIPKKNEEILKIVIKNEDNKSTICQFCNKQLSRVDNLKRHIIKCKEKLNVVKIEVKNKELEEQNKRIIEEMIKMKADITNLSKTTGTKSIINLNNSGTINIVNHINSLGYENIQKNLTEKEKILLLTSMRVKEHPIIELVRMIYTEDKFKGERNTVITNLRSKECLTYNSDANKFDATAKKDHIDNIIENRRTNIVAIYKELSQNNKLRPVEIKIIDAYLEEIEDLGKKNPKVKALYEKHKAEIIYIIYNCKEFMNRLRENMPNVVEQEDSTDYEENNIEV